MSRRRGNEPPPFRFEWERTVKAVILPSTVKHVALNLATYADAEGGEVFPGNERLVSDTGLSDRTVRSALDRLRDVGLVERVAIGSRGGRRGIADVYRLTIPVDLLERVVLVSEARRTPAARAADRTGTPAAGAADPGSEHRQLTTGTPATDAGTPATDDRNTGRRCRTPDHDQHKYQPLPTTTPVHEVSTDRARAAANGHTRPREDTPR